MPGNELQVGDSMLIAWASLGFSAGALAMLVLVAVLLSSYVKIATVLSIVRAGFGFYSLPSAFITGGLAIALSFFVMYPTLEQATEAAKRAAHSQSGNPTDLSRAQASEAALEQQQRQPQRALQYRQNYCRSDFCADN